MSKLTCCLSLLVCLAVCYGAAWADPTVQVVIPHPVSEIVAFGDSLSDTGNVWLATGTAFPPEAFGYFQGRFTNGSVWVEHLATTYAIPVLSPSLGGGTNQAWGGARSGDGTSQLSQVPGLDVWNVGKQVTEYVNAGGSFGPTTLVTIWAGGNDLLFDQADPADVAQNVADAVNDLIGAGAREFLVLNQVPLGETPGARAQGPAVQALLNGLSAGYRTELASRLAVWDADPDVTVHELDVYTLFSDVLADPTAYGFQNIEDPAINFPAANPDEFAFWDDFHPTTAGHSVIAGQVQIVPEPAALALIGVGGLIVSIWLAQRRLARKRF